MGGESLNRTHVAAYGLYGDRSHAFADESLEGWERYFTARGIPQLLKYQAKLVEGTASANEFPPIRVTSPDGHEFTWDEGLLGEIQGYSKRKISMIRYRPDSRDSLAVDAGGILIITDRTLNKLEHFLGREVDQRRFRANLVVTISDDRVQDEAELVGKRLRIGEVQLEVTEACERCSMITLDPDTLERDVAILKKVNEQFNLRFGVYASVVEVGDIGVDDTVYMEA
ncbi:MOSC domain-containing protein [Cohnella cholangitidis]|uniref:MOSC domain-containing protein n=2 Tax=Cohnella cholangitidis TaxID=2598458 RepID=A0A7G5C741_9BACL|nr:MOSC domain-containing protein [Cohnella cholangitidis]